MTQPYPAATPDQIPNSPERRVYPLFPASLVPLRPEETDRNYQLRLRRQVAEAARTNAGPTANSRSLEHMVSNSFPIPWKKSRNGAPCAPAGPRHRPHPD